MTAYAANSIAQSPLRVRWPLFLVLGATGELVCIALDSDLSVSLTSFAEVILLMTLMFFMIALVSAILSSDGRQVIGAVASLFVVFLVLSAMVTVHAGLPALVVAAMMGVITIFRYHRLYTGKAMAGVHLHFSIDTGVLVVVSGYFGLGLVVGALPYGPAVSGFFGVLALTTILGWMYVLWVFERSLTGTQRARRGGIVVMLGLALVCGLFGLKAVYYGLLLVLGGGGLLLAPLLGFVPKLTVPLKKIQQQTSQSGQHPSAKQFHAPPPLISPHILHLLATIVSVCAIGVLLYLIVRRKPTAASAASEQAVLQVVARRSMRGSRDLFVATDDPVRIRIQQWLRSRLAAGLHIGKSDTIRTLVVQAQPDDGLQTEQLQDYEDRRYGGRPST